MAPRDTVARTKEKNTMNKNTLHSLRVGILLAGLLMAGSARAADVSWNTGADGYWDTGANWTGGQVPGVGDSAFMTNRHATYTVTYTNAASQIDLLQVGSIDTTTGKITLEIDGTGFALGSKTGSIDDFKTAVLHGVLHVKPNASMTLSHPSESAGHNWTFVSRTGHVLLEGALEIFGSPRFGWSGASTTTVTNGGALKFSWNDVGSLNYITIGMGSTSARHTLRVDGGSVEVGNNVWMDMGSGRGHGVIEVNSGSYWHNSGRNMRIGNTWADNRGSAQVRINGGTFTITNATAITYLGVTGQTPGATLPNSVNASTSHLFRVTGGVAELGAFEMGGNIENYTRNHLEVSGGSMRATSLKMGQAGINSSTNSALVTGTGSLTVSGALTVLRRATFQMDGGTTTVNSLIADQGADDSILLFNAGTLNVTNATVDTGVETVIGDGTGAMQYRVLGGTNTFAQHLTVNTAATLAVWGAGAIETPMLTFTSGAKFELDREGIAPEVPFVALAVDGDVTLPVSLTVSVTGLSAPAPASIPLITITGSFTGSPADWPRTSVHGDDYEAVTDGATLQLQRVPRGTMIFLR